MDKDKEMGSWQEHQMFVVESLKDLKEAVKELANSFSDHQTETRNQLAKLKQSAAVRRVKSSLYGTIGGSLVILANTIVKWVIENHK